MGDPLLQIIVGFIAILLASLLERYCEFGRLAQTKYKPGILKTSFRWVLEALWVVVLLAAAGLLFIRGWLLALIGVLAFWVILPIILTPILRYRLLPHWDEVKAELEPKGLNEKNYWREDWWMVEDRKKKGRRKRRL